MVRITKYETQDATVAFRIEGKLASKAAAAEVWNSCDPHLAAGKSMELDLAELDYVDDVGLCVLKQLLSRGCSLHNISNYLSSLIATIECKDNHMQQGQE